MDLMLRGASFEGCAAERTPTFALSCSQAVDMHPHQCFVCTTHAVQELKRKITGQDQASTGSGSSSG